MNYPQSGAGGEPVIICMGRVLVAFDAATGVVRWNHVAAATILRLFRVGARVLATTGESVICVEATTGQLVGTVQLGFQPDAGLAIGTDLILSSGTSSGSESPRVACLGSDGSIKWRATIAAAGPENVLRVYGGDNSRRSEIRYPRTGYNSGILFGATVAQPDRE